ncbi:MAG: hypothetical protein WCK31_00095 [bacterium]
MTELPSINANKSESQSESDAGHRIEIQLLCNCIRAFNIKNPDAIKPVSKEDYDRYLGTISAEEFLSRR